MSAALINPGTGPVERPRFSDALHNMRVLAGAVGARRWRYIKASGGRTTGRGRYEFFVWVADRRHRVEMPGLPLAIVRDANVLQQPRLYVDGSSWWWKFAVEELTGGHG